MLLRTNRLGEIGSSRANRNMLTLQKNSGKRRNQLKKGSAQALETLIRGRFDRGKTIMSIRKSPTPRPKFMAANRANAALNRMTSGQRSRHYCLALHRSGRTRSSPASFLTGSDRSRLGFQEGRKRFGAEDLVKIDAAMRLGIEDDDGVFCDRVGRASKPGTGGGVLRYTGRQFETSSRAVRRWLS